MSHQIYKANRNKAKYQGYNLLVVFLQVLGQEQDSEKRTYSQARPSHILQSWIPWNYPGCCPFPEGNRLPGIAGNEISHFWNPAVSASSSSNRVIRSSRSEILLFQKIKFPFSALTFIFHYCFYFQASICFFHGGNSHSRNARIRKGRIIQTMAINKPSVPARPSL